MRALRAAWVSLAAGVVILGLKWLAWALTGSVALYSDALESVVNVVAAGAAVAALRVAARPADDRHTFGHSKAEYFSAVLEGVLIVLAALAIGWQAWGRLTEPQPLEGLEAGMLVSLAASAVNGVLALYLVRRGRALRSPALVADGLHVGTDVATSGGVLVGIGLAWLTGWWILDPVLALVVAVNILWTGSRVVRESVGGLMDEALPPEELERLEQVLAQRRPGVLEIHDLKTRRAGRLTFIQFHLVVPSTMTVDDAHHLCDRLEADLRRTVEGSQIHIHVEPESEAQHRGITLHGRH